MNYESSNLGVRASAFYMTSRFHHTTEIALSSFPQLSLPRYIAKPNLHTMCDTLSIPGTSRSLGGQHTDKIVGQILAKTDLLGARRASDRTNAQSITKFPVTPMKHVHEQQTLHVLTIALLCLHTRSEDRSLNTRARAGRLCVCAADCSRMQVADTQTHRRTAWLRAATLLQARRADAKANKLPLFNLKSSSMPSWC